jgi:hypothetical protein
MATPPDIPIHYDHVIGANPEWRSLLRAAFLGNLTPIQSQLLNLGGISPSTVHFLKATYHYALEGHQTFCVGPAMQEVFEECDLREVPKELIRLPYECFWVALPGSTHRVWGDERTGWHPVTGCYVHQSKENPHWFRLLMWGAPNEKSVDAMDDANFWFEINLEGCEGRVEGSYTILDIEDYMAKCFASEARDQSDPYIKKQAARHMQETAAEFVHVLRIVINLILYLNSDKPEARKDNSRAAAQRKAAAAAARKKNPAKARKARAQVESMSQAHVTWIGETVERHAKAAAASRGSGVALHRRRGHRHSYWVGKRVLDDGTRQKGERIIVKFVAPTWIGGKPDDGVKGKHPGRVYQFEGDE